jgi:hypothetical protein
MWPTVTANRHRTPPANDRRAASILGGRTTRGRPAAHTRRGITLAARPVWRWPGQRSRLPSGWNTFSAYEADGVTVAQVQLLMRADDPLFELAMVVFAHRMEDRHWQQTLHNLAAHLSVEKGIETDLIA